MEGVAACRDHAAPVTDPEWLEAYRALALPVSAPRSPLFSFFPAFDGGQPLEVRLRKALTLGKLVVLL
jgi:hypothetical protein